MPPSLSALNPCDTAVSSCPEEGGPQEQVTSPPACFEPGLDTFSGAVQADLGTYERPGVLPYFAPLISITPGTFVEGRSYPLSDPANVARLPEVIRPYAEALATVPDAAFSVRSNTFYLHRAGNGPNPSEEASVATGTPGRGPSQPVSRVQFAVSSAANLGLFLVIDYELVAPLVEEGELPRTLRGPIDITGLYVANLVLEQIGLAPRWDWGTLRGIPRFYSYQVLTGLLLHDLYGEEPELQGTQGEITSLALAMPLFGLTTFLERRATTLLGRVASGEQTAGRLLTGAARGVGIFSQVMGGFGSVGLVDSVSGSLTRDILDMNGLSNDPHLRFAEFVWNSLESERSQEDVIHLIGSTLLGNTFRTLAWATGVADDEMDERSREVILSARDFADSLLENFTNLAAQCLEPNATKFREAMLEIFPSDQRPVVEAQIRELRVEGENDRQQIERLTRWLRDNGADDSEIAACAQRGIALNELRFEQSLDAFYLSMRQESGGQAVDDMYQLLTLTAHLAGPMSAVVSRTSSWGDIRNRRQFWEMVRDAASERLRETRAGLADLGVALEISEVQEIGTIGTLALRSPSTLTDDEIDLLRTQGTQLTLREIQLDLLLQMIEEQILRPPPSPF